ncbi:hypothetical protein D0817_05210 [Flavobacterium cupreum]|uniref:Uncharacterized protein n=1 Tax=Flavobacterium cupreum TaxID=2133766 RepID=A0A434AA79_9FLAO|nr:hypothetical protein [Flavobacterium cupreum]RUT71281.1 hypothetical protein D0817_05210 [Flavobacterium cupreum]
MKKNIILIFIIFIFSCKNYKSYDKYCIKKIEFINQSRNLIPSIVKIQIEDSNDSLKNLLALGKLKKVILYSVKANDRDFFYLAPFGTGKQFNIEGEVINLSLMTTLYEKEFGNRLSDIEIEKKVNGDIGLVVDKDTIVIKKCETISD